MILRRGPVLITWADAGTAAPTPRRSVGDGLLLRLASHLVPGADAAIGRRCPRCGAADHGRPVAAGAPVALSLGYAGSMVIAAAVRTVDAASIGVDIEAADRDIGDLRALFAPREPPDLAGWTRIEATLKADGSGIRIDPASVVIDGGRARRPGPFDVATIDGPDGYVVSVAVAAPAPR